MDTESPLIHYLDNLLTMRQADSSACYNHLPIIKEVCPHINNSLILEKLKCLLPYLTFLGTILDTKYGDKSPSR